MIEVVHSPLDLVTSRNPVLVELHDDDGNQPNHRFEILCVISNASRTVNVYLLEFPINSNGIIDFSKLIDDFLNETDYILPNLAMTGTSKQNVSAAILCDMQLFINTAFGFPLIEVDDTIDLPSFESGSMYKCLRGGFSYPNWPERKYIYHWLLQAGEDAPFLTWKPKVCYISPTQPEFLTFIDVAVSEHDSRDLHLYVDIKYTDGSSNTFDGSTLVSYGFLAYQYAVGIKQLSLDEVEPDKTIMYYKVCLKLGDERITEERTYYVDYHKHQAERFVLFANSLGGWDTARFVGTGEFQSDYVRLNSDVAQGKYSNLQGMRKTVENEEQAGRKINTGYIARTDLHWLRELFLSSDVQTLEDGKLIPINIVSKKFSMQEESSLNALTVEYDHRFTNTVYTPKFQPVTYVP